MEILPVLNIVDLDLPPIFIKQSELRFKDSDLSFSRQLCLTAASWVLDLDNNSFHL